MVADYAAGGFSALVCWDLDRLTRQPRQFEDWIDAMEPSTVTTILRNPRYAGWSMLDGKIVRDGGGRPVAGQWRPIVSDTLWLEVQRRLDDPAQVQPQRDGPWRYSHG